MLRIFLVVFVTALSAPAFAHSACAPWSMHVVGTGSGADGARLADADNDGDLDVVSGYEQGAVTRLYLNPGPALVANPWPSIEAHGSTPDVEDAVIGDIDMDGSPDIVSATEGSDKGLWIAFAPWDNTHSPRQIGLHTQPSSPANHRYMFSVISDLNGDGRNDIITGGKNGGHLGFYMSKDGNIRDKSTWSYYHIRKMGWTMNLILRDMDGDGDDDIVLSDRRVWNDPNGQRPSVDSWGIYWLENPGASTLDANPATPWVEHYVGMHGLFSMFMDVGDIDGDGILDIVGTQFETQTVRVFYGQDSSGTSFEQVTLVVQGLAEIAGTSGKGATIADLDNDGAQEIVYVTDNAGDGRQGVVMLRHLGSPRDHDNWTFEPISGPAGVKFDLVTPVDLDGDGDLDLVTTEETENLGVVWYENPLY